MIPPGLEHPCRSVFSARHGCTGGGTRRAHAVAADALGRGRSCRSSTPGQIAASVPLDRSAPSDLERALAPALDIIAELFVARIAESELLPRRRVNLASISASTLGVKPAVLLGRESTEMRVLRLREEAARTLVELRLADLERLQEDLLHPGRPLPEVVGLGCLSNREGRARSAMNDSAPGGPVDWSRST